MKLKLKTFQQKYKEGTKSMDEIEQSLYGWLGHAEQGDTYRLREKMLNEFILTRGNEDEKRES